MIRLGNAPTSWGIERAFDPTYPPWSTVLGEARAAGFDGIELGPFGYLPATPPALRRVLRENGLTLTAGVVMDTLHSTDRTSVILQSARRTCELLASQGATKLVIISGFDDERVRTAGRSQAAQRLDQHQSAVLVSTIEDVALIASDYGLRALLHTHAGTHIEFRDELDGVLNACDPATLGLCLDTGHAMYAGMDPVELIDTYRGRLGYVHAKDVDPVVLKRVGSEGLDFWSAYRAGVFCPVGDGCVDFGGVVDALRRADYDDWITIEQDADPSAAASVLESARASANFLSACLLKIPERSVDHP